MDYLPLSRLTLLSTISNAVLKLAFHAVYPHFANTTHVATACRRLPLVDC